MPAGLKQHGHYHRPWDRSRRGGGGLMPWVSNLLVLRLLRRVPVGIARDRWWRLGCQTKMCLPDCFFIFYERETERTSESLSKGQRVLLINNQRWTLTPRLPLGRRRRQSVLQREKTFIWFHLSSHEAQNLVIRSSKEVPESCWKED